MTSRRMFLASLATGSLAVWLFDTGAATAQPYPYQPIPEPRYEPVPHPRSGYLWEPGHWHWNGRQYAWFSGRYVPVRAEYHRYVQGFWVQHGPRWEWLPAHWE